MFSYRVDVLGDVDDRALIIGFTMAIIAVYLIVDLAVDLVALDLDQRLKNSDQ